VAFAECGLQDTFTSRRRIEIMMRNVRVLLYGAFCLGLVLLTSSQPAAGQETIDLAGKEAQSQWIFDQPGSTKIESGELILDGRKQLSRAYYLPVLMSDGEVTARLRVEDQPEGVLAFGMIFGATETRRYHYVHFDRNQAILVECTPDQSWKEIQRISGLTKPAGTWHTAQVKVTGNQVTVSLNGDVLYSSEVANYQTGRVGFYASQGLVNVKEIQLNGQLVRASRLFVESPRSFITVCSDAGAGAYEAFPDVCRLSDGRLMATFYAGYGHISYPNETLPMGGRVSYCTSSDEGATWSEARVLVDTAEDDRDPSLVQLPDGRLLCNFFTYVKDGGGTGTWIVSSDDLGETWSEPKLITRAGYVSSPIRVLSSGRLVLPLYTASKTDATGAVMLSDDNGETWGPLISIDNGGVRLDAETDVIELKDGTLFAALRELMGYSTSSDQGETWTVAKPIGFPGHSPYLHRATNGEIILSFRLPVTNMRVSRDEAKTWGEPIQIDSVTGAYPSMVNLKDGSVLVVYYEEGQGSDIRARKFRVTEDSVEFIPISR